MAYPELQLIGRWTHTGTQAANTAWSPPPLLSTSPNLAQGYLNGQQVGEVAYAVVRAPVDPTTGIGDALQGAQLTLDGNDYPYVWWSAQQEYNVAPDPQQLRAGSVVYLGQPTFGPNGQIAGLLDATCPKFITSCTIKAWAGATAVTHPYTVEVWGYLYDSVQLAGLMPVYNPPNAIIPDPLNGRQFVVVGPQGGVAAQGDWRAAWKALPAGTGQGQNGATPVFPLLRFGNNQNATTASQAYIPQYQNSSQTPAVQAPQNNMYFTLNAQQALLLRRWGVLGPAAPNSTGYDLQSSWIQTPSERQQEHPAGLIPVNYNQNRARYGQAAGQDNVFLGLPQLPQGQQLVTKETAYPTFVDNGTSIPATLVNFALYATLIGTTDQGV